MRLLGRRCLHLWRRAVSLLAVSALSPAGCTDRSGTAPPPPPPPPPAVHLALVAAGASHTCGADSVGVAYCWGLGTSGALGADTVSGAVNPVPVVAGSLHFDSISAGQDFNCALTHAGKAYCWGVGAQGQLGTGSRTAARAPVAVAADTLVFAGISAGGTHTCAVARSGQAYCWGAGTQGELGNNLVRDSAAPGAVLDTAHYLSVSTGLHHSCGLTNQGLIRCWGWNALGQLGVGSLVGLGAPFKVQGNVHFAALSAGRDFTCGLSNTGAAYCWGHNDFGQLGRGDFQDSPAPVAVQGGLSFVSISAGGMHVCGLTAAGTAYCWGSNSDGQLGAGSPGAAQPQPLAVEGGLHFRRLTAGGLHTCGVTTDSSVYCWGFGGFGQLGDGSALPRPQPAQVVSSG